MVMPKKVDNPGQLIDWVKKSRYRVDLLLAIVEQNAAGYIPNGAQVIRQSGLNWCRSAQSNANQALKELRDTNLLINHGTKTYTELEVNWQTLGLISDWMEENGQDRLDDQLKKGNFRSLKVKS